MLLDKIDAFRAEPYTGPAGEWTVGFGHKLTTSEVSSGKIVINGMACRPPLTKDQGRALLDQDIAAASAALPANLSPVQHAALTSLVIDIGAEAFRGSTLFKVVLDGKSASDVVKEIRKWVKVRNPKTGAVEISRALTLRRKAQADHFLGL